MKDNPEIFPNIRLDALKREAAIWAKTFPEIKKITLHPCTAPLKFGAIYILIWELLSDLSMSPLDFVISKKTLFSKRFIDVYQQEPDFGFRDDWDIYLKDSKTDLKDLILKDAYWLLYERPLGDNKEKKLRPSQRHKLECRKIAEKLWKYNPSLTIADVIDTGEIIEACEGKIYIEKTIRNWIKDLCPNRKPGRRPQN